MSLTKHYAPLMIPLDLHQEPTQPEFHCYPAAEVDSLSQDCAVLREEINDKEEELDDARKEIARLSSPPPERAEIVLLQRARKALADSGAITSIFRRDLMHDIDTLLADCAALRNAHQDRVQMLSFVQDSLTQRNRECVELRERCGRLEAERDQLKAAKLQHDTQQRAAALALHDERIERLEGALQFYAALENHQGNAATGHVPIVDDDNLGDRARAALCEYVATPALIDPRPVGGIGIDQGQFLASCGGGNAAFGERNSGPKCAVCGFAEQMSIHEPRLHGHPLPFGRGHYHQFQREAERAEGGQS